jgi:prevent-host-death family protein
MKYSEQVKPISYLKSHTADIVRNLTETREPLLITQNGEAKLVVMDVKSFEEQRETLALLKILALSRKDIEEGNVYSTEDVFAEIEKD